MVSNHWLLLDRLIIDTINLMADFDRRKKVISILVTELATLRDAR